jgi:parallel beta-helix repeat protein
MRAESAALVLCAIVLVCAGKVDFWLVRTAGEASAIIVPDDYSTIQGAINGASDGDTIFVESGVYFENVVVNKSVSIVAENRENTIIDGNGTGNVVTINTNSVNITGLTVQDSRSIGTAIGIHLDGAGLCNISGNNIRGNFDSGIGLEWSSANLIEANSIVTNDIVTNLEGGISVVYSHNNTLTGNYIALHGIVGIAVAWSHNNTLSWNNVTQIAGPSDFHAINLWRSERNYISQNRVWASKGYGIRFEGQSDHNILSDNFIENCSTGLVVRDSSNYNMLSRNLIVNNSDGIALGQYSNYNTIVENTMIENGYGIHFDLVGYSTQNIILNNNVINNTQQVRIASGSVNAWNGVYLFVDGNYWSDYASVDLYHGPYQNETGSDGIGDIPYIIDEDNADAYPLMSPWSPPIGDINKDGVVGLPDLVLLAKAYGSKSEDLNWNPHADLDHNLIVGLADLVILAKHYGQHHS